MKYKNLKLKVILPSILIVVIAVMLVAFFTGGLEAGAASYTNEPWTTNGFLTPESAYDDNSNPIWLVGGKQIETNKLVAKNENYEMYINEDTTVVSIYKINADKSLKFIYSTASATSSVADEKSNLNLYYYDPYGKLSTGLNVYEKSIKYSNKIKGTDEKHYSLRYNSDGTLDILYQIGEFANIKALFPTYYNRVDFEDRFVGNTYFAYENSYADCVVKNADGSTTIAKQTKLNPSNNGFGFCLDNEAALYILKNGLATIKYSTESTEYTVVPNEESEILEKSGGYWYLYNILDENGILKFKYGENTNVSSSPVTANPFLTAADFSSLSGMFANNFYPIKYDVINDKGEKEIKVTTIEDRVNLENSYLQFHAEEPQTSSELYRELAVGDYQYIETTQEIYSYLQSSDADKIGKLMKLAPVTYQDNNDNTIYFDYNNDGEITSDEYYVFGGCQARDPQGNYLYIDENNYVFYFDESGNRMLNDDEGVPQSVDSTASYKPLQSGITSDIREEQNAKYNVTVDSSSVAFQVALRFKLNTDGLEVTVLNDSIIEGLGSTNTEVETYFRHDCKIAKLEICKYLTTNNVEGGTGSIIIPDGSGAVISFNSPKEKQNVGKYNEKYIYGNDSAINREEMGAKSQSILLPMYGFIENDKDFAVVAIVEKGASQTTITADFMRKDSSLSGISLYNYAYFTTYLRSSENVKITSSSSYLKVSEQRYGSDIKYVYRFLDAEKLGKAPETDQTTLANYEPINYVDIANNYRSYLIDKYSLTEKDTTKVSTPTITFIGAYEKKNIKMGVVYDKEYSLTTFEEAGKIVDELTEKGVSSMNVSYTLWTKDEKFNKISDDVDVASVLGGKSDLEDLTNKIYSYNYNFFLDYKVTTGFGYDYAFGALKFNAKSISGSQSNALSYVLSTGLADAQGKVGGRLSPVFYNSLVTKYMKNYGTLGINGINVVDLGNTNTSDYSKNRTIYAADGALLQQKALQTIVDSGKKVMLEAPGDYAFKYVDIANNVPVETTLYPIVDYSIPFYQLVVSGLFDYTSPTINSGNDYSYEWNLLKAIETGSNVSFEISASDTIDLLDTQYTSYYNSYYSNWKDKILSMNQTLNSTGIYESKLINHEFISDTVVKVTYSNGLSIIINYSNKNYQENGVAVRANDFAVIKTGEGA